VDKALAELIRISNAAGKDSAFVQGSGGNTSVKTTDGKYMYIKASGTALKNMSHRVGWRRMRLDLVQAIIKDKSVAGFSVRARETEVANRLLFACGDKKRSKARPSIEAHLHAVLDRCVIHLHPVAVLSYTCAVNGRSALEKLFKDEKYPPVWIPYADPGFKLAGKVAKLTADYQNRFGRKPAVLFLQKHGLIVSADSADAALRLLRKVIKRCAGRLKWLKTAKAKPSARKAVADVKLCICRAFYRATGRYVSVNYFYDDFFAAFWRQKNARNLLSVSALTPDELRYANGSAMWAWDCDPEKIAHLINSKIKRNGKPPVAFLVKGTGLFIVGNRKFALIVRDVVKSSLAIRVNASRMGGVVSLNKAEREFINQWEAGG